MSTTYHVQFWTNVYVTVPVEAESYEAACEVASKRLPSRPVTAQPTDDAPEGMTVEILHGEWDIVGPDEDGEG